MRDLEAELKSLKLFGMATGYAEVAGQGGASLQSSEWLLRQLLQAEIEAVDMAVVPFAPKSSYGTALIEKLGMVKILSVLSPSNLNLYPVL